jgi:hypothetical protein
MGRWIALLALTLVLAGCTNYGTKLEFNKGELYYTEKVTEAEAKKLGNFLVEASFFNGDEKSVQLTKEGETYQIRYPVKEGFEKDANYEKTAAFFGAALSKELFDNKPVEIHMTDDGLKTVKVVKMDANAEPVLN